MDRWRNSHVAQSSTFLLAQRHFNSLYLTTQPLFKQHLVYLNYSFYLLKQTNSSWQKKTSHSPFRPEHSVVSRVHKGWRTSFATSALKETVLPEVRKKHEKYKIEHMFSSGFKSANLLAEQWRMTNHHRCMDRDSNGKAFISGSGNKHLPIKVYNVKYSV